MPQYLMAISIGPVQGFIAAARRTRDFWMGSLILGECAKGVARGVLTEAAKLRGTDLAQMNDTAREMLLSQTLVFPAPPDYSALAAADFDPANIEVKAEFDVTNVVLAEVAVAAESPPNTLATIAERLKEVAQNQWRQIARKAAEQCSNDLRPGWEKQLCDEVIEFYSAWVELRNYEKSRQAVMRLLAGRKACRDFPAWRGEAGLPKSSLDGARETVLLEQRRRSRLRVKTKEQLDIVGVAKRAEWGHDAIRYPSISRVAIDPWVRGVVAVSHEDSEVARCWSEVNATCQSLKNLGVLRLRKQTNPRGIENDLDKFPWLRSFPFEGSPLYINRHTELHKEFLEERPHPAGEVPESVTTALDGLKTQVRDLSNLHAYAKPWEYAAFLIADGDRMGATLSAISRFPDGLAKHREFSRQQSAFAIAARGVINSSEYSGACFFASADDIQAMVAVDHALPLARRLHELFEEKLGSLARQWGLELPTLSVGIAIGHFMEPLEDLLEYARAAEKRAKNPTKEDRGQTSRNGLAIAIQPRGGAPFTIRDNWKPANDEGCLDNRLKTWAELHRSKRLPTKAAYDLRELARGYERPWKDESAQARAIQRDALRVLGRKRAPPSADAIVSPFDLQSHPKSLVKQLIEDRVKSSGDLDALAHELIVGQWIGDAMSQAEGRRRPSAATSEHPVEEAQI